MWDYYEPSPELLSHESAFLVLSPSPSGSLWSFDSDWPAESAFLRSGTRNLWIQYVPLVVLKAFKFWELIYISVRVINPVGGTGQHSWGIWEQTYFVDLEYLKYVDLTIDLSINFETNVWSSLLACHSLTDHFLSLKNAPFLNFLVLTSLPLALFLVSDLTFYLTRTFRIPRKQSHLLLCPVTFVSSLLRSSSSPPQKGSKLSSWVNPHSVLLIAITTEVKVYQSSLPLCFSCPQRHLCVFVILLTSENGKKTKYLSAMPILVCLAYSCTFFLAVYYLRQEVPQVLATSTLLSTHIQPEFFCPF